MATASNSRQKHHSMDRTALECTCDLGCPQIKPATTPFPASSALGEVLEGLITGKKINQGTKMRQNYLRTHLILLPVQPGFW